MVEEDSTTTSSVQRKKGRRLAAREVECDKW